MLWRQQCDKLAAVRGYAGESGGGHTGHKQQGCVQVLLQPTAGGSGVAEAANDGGGKVADAIGVNWSRVGFRSFHSLRNNGS